MARVSKHRPFLLSHLEVDPCRPIARGDKSKRGVSSQHQDWRRKLRSNSFLGARHKSWGIQHRVHVLMLPQGFITSLTLLTLDIATRDCMQGL